MGEPGSTCSASAFCSAADQTTRGQLRSRDEGQNQNQFSGAVDTWQVTVQCYYWGANSSGYQYQSGGTQTRSSTCPWTSYVTKVLVQSY